MGETITSIGKAAYPYYDQTTNRYYFSATCYLDLATGEIVTTKITFA